MVKSFSSLQNQSAKVIQVGNGRLAWGNENAIKELQRSEKIDEDAKRNEFEFWRIDLDLDEPQRVESAVWPFSSVL